VWLLFLRLLQIRHNLLSPSGSHDLLSPDGFLFAPMRSQPGPGGKGGGGGSAITGRWRRRWGGAVAAGWWGRGA
jgi:hypothetical protein